MASLKIILPLPPVELSPNGRYHWGAKHPKTQQVKHDAKLAAISARNAAGMQGMFSKPVAQPIFYFAKKRRRDRDNFSAMLKPVWDSWQGLLYENDSCLTPLPAVLEIDANDPRLEIEIREQL